MLDLRPWAGLDCRSMHDLILQFRTQLKSRARLRARESMGRIRLAGLLACFAILNAAAPTPAQAALDHLGDFSLSNFFLEPSATYAERRTGGFGFGNSYLEVNWTQQNYLSVVMKLGSSDLIGRPARYGDPASAQIQFIEAYGQLSSDWGQLRSGLIPLAFGLEGGDTEMNLRFPRSLLFSRRIIGLRDEGISYRITTDGFVSEWAVSNGESGADKDDRLWLTARTGWTYGRFLRMGFSLQTGNTTAKSTDPASKLTPPQSGFDPTRPSHVRIADAFFRYGDKAFGMELEAAAGDTTQLFAIGTTTERLRFLRVDTDWQFWRGLTALARYDILDPDASARGDLVQETVAGLAWRDAYETSVLTLLFSKVMDQAAQTSHQVQLIWRLTPVAMGRLSPL